MAEEYIPDERKKKISEEELAKTGNNWKNNSEK